MKGKEYGNNGNLIFEGEYKNEKKWNGKISFENKSYELLDGSCKINSSKFEGEFINGEKRGKEYDYYNQKLLFEGDYLNEKKWNGIAKEYIVNKLIFEGEYIKGEKKGKEYNFIGELIFEGEYKNGIKWNGKGYDSDGNEIINLIKGNGKIKEYDFYGRLIFDGEYLDGKKWKGKEYYIGQFSSAFYPNENEEDNNKVTINFRGKFFNISGNKLKGPIKFEGQYLNGENNRHGKEYDENGKLIFDGNYSNGVRNGFGKEYNNYGKLIFEGEYLNGKIYNGKRKEYDNYGRLIFEGNYLKGKIWNGDINIYDNYDKLIFKKQYLAQGKMIEDYDSYLSVYIQL